MAATTLPPALVTTTETKAPRIAATIGRVAIMLGVLALIGAWFAQLSENGLRFTQEHLFSDAIVLMLLGIAFLVDSLLHARRI